MALPDPLSDNPMRWDGWKLYASPNVYERLGLEFAENPTAAQIESNCRQLLMWWQKKLPLKNQPSNPLAQLLRSGMDEAPAKLAEARTLLLDPESRSQIDTEILAAQKAATIAEFHKFLSFVLTSGELDLDEEENLYVVGGNLGLKREEMVGLVEEELAKGGMKRCARKSAEEPTALVAAPSGTASPASSDPRSEFLRMLRLSALSEITDDQRDAFCNMGETLGLSGGDAEDIIDDYLEEKMKASVTTRPTTRLLEKKAALHSADGAPPSPLQRAEEKKAFPNFISSAEIPMLLVPTGVFVMGSNDPEAAPIERPPTKTRVSVFYLSRWPITNAQYELFDPAHRSKRAPRAGDNHPVVYVSHTEASRFCAWLSQCDKRKYRLPTEAEWEYAARGMDGRKFPWGNRLDANDLANFADANKNLPWSERTINCGFAETSPVGSFPRGVGPFGMEDMAGNVWEWCLDCLAPYPGRERSNPRGPLEGLKQIYRGGSWKSRIASLRTSNRATNAPAYSANDVGFRVLCECGK
ncbi:MAG: formylglycine-generating enzyme family protein [Verrucomicrobia bacterium]|nr:formylglycine-generating enzyme family protein [Verrucomicrobiota bacterium]